MLWREKASTLSRIDGESVDQRARLRSTMVESGWIEHRDHSRAQKSKEVKIEGR